MGLIRIMTPPPNLSIYKPNVLNLASDTKVSEKLSIDNLDAGMNYTAKSVDLGEIGGAFSKLINVSISGFQKRLSHIEVSVPTRAMYTGSTSVQGNILDKIF